MFSSRLFFQVNKQHLYKLSSSCAHNLTTLNCHHPLSATANAVFASRTVSNLFKDTTVELTPKNADLTRATVVE